MQLLVDAKDYSPDMRWLGYLSLFIIILIVGAAAVAYILGGGPAPYGSMAICLGFLVVIFVAILKFYLVGFLTYAPLKIYDGGVEMQQGSKRTFVAFADIESLHIFLKWNPVFVDKKCEIRTISQKSLSSKEYFSHKWISAFIKKIEPIMKEKGFHLVEKKDRGYLSYKFIR